MNTFINNYSYESIVKKFKILYFLNVADIIFTIVLLQTNLFEEGNKVMATIVDNPLKAVFIKVILVFFLIRFILYRMKDATLKQLKISNYILIVITILYSLVLLTHILNISLIISIFLTYS